MKIEIIQKFYDYSWRVNNPYDTWSSNECNSKNVNVTTHLRVIDSSGNIWDILDNGNRYNNDISKNEHSRYDLILETFNVPHKSNHQHRFVIGHEYDDVSNYNSIIFRCCALKHNFNLEIIDKIEYTKYVQNPLIEHYIGFAEQFIEMDYDKFPEAIDKDPFIQCGIRCEIRPADNMFHWLNNNNPMNSEEYDECCRKQTQIISLDKLEKDEAIKVLNNAIENELEILDLGSNMIDIINVIEKFKRENTEK
ncbi:MULTISPECIES: hypothetical protein [Myroides]|uniref:hypothetical protein n=1 Tax=Myroides TaxID=76831 RepID=UPI0025751912|nr:MULTISPECIES: hypothetical protein [Myroides]MDM1348963.1 hypothetical protein [Myroides marinus]MDM1451675.1 hypothetical protein [Myroides odoratimimus]MDM1454971.1 hypothetical protein [Myroides odoratimimus]MDM1478694.1 hypothetical protein [Myroides odoratimimus]MDM1491023.1 hypothetical protein [Myroides odoratimimus]